MARIDAVLKELNNTKEMLFDQQVLTREMEEHHEEIGKKQERFFKKKLNKAENKREQLMSTLN